MCPAENNLGLVCLPTGKNTLPPQGCYLAISNPGLPFGKSRALVAMAPSVFDQRQQVSFILCVEVGCFLSPHRTEKRPRARAWGTFGSKTKCGAPPIGSGDKQQQRHAPPTKTRGPKNRGGPI